MPETTADVLIIGAGASGAAFAWSLAETRMNILCLEQGDWMVPRASRACDRLGGAPARRLRLQPQHPRAARGLSGQRRGLADRGLDVQRRRRQHDPLRGALPALPPVGLPGPDARRRRRRLAARLPAARAVLRRQRAHDGRLRPRRRSGVSAEGGAAAAGARSASSARRWRAASTASAGTGGRPTAPSPPQEYEGRAPCINAGTCLLGCAQGAKASTDITYWPPALRHGVTLRDALPRARDHRRRERHGRRRHLLRRRRRRAPAEGARRGARVQRHRHAAPAAQLALDALPRRPRQPQRPGRQEPDVPSLRDGDRRLRRAARGLQGPDRLLHHEPGVLRDRSRRAASCAATRSRSCAASGRCRPRCGACRRGACRGAPTITAPTRELFDRTAGMVVDLRGPARAEPTASRSIPSSPTPTASRRRRSPIA